jgi:hypothetical protein
MARSSKPKDFTIAARVHNLIAIAVHETIKHTEQVLIMAILRDGGIGAIGMVIGPFPKGSFAFL